MKTILFLCPSRFSIGELYNAVQLAEALGDDAGIRPVFLVTDSYAGYAARSGFEEHVFPSRTADNRTWFRALVAHLEPHTIVLADHQNLALERVSIDAESVYELPAHIVVIDSLQFAPGPREVSFGISRVRGADRIRRWMPATRTIAAVPEHVTTLTPIPVASTATAVAPVSVYTAVPTVERSRASVLDDLGIDRSRRVVVSAQSGWAAMGFDQISRGNHRGRYADLRRARLVSALASADRATALVEIGAVQRTADESEGVQSVVIPRLGRQAFTDLLAAADLYVTDNLISGAMAQAATIGTPVLALIHSGSRTSQSAIDAEMDDLYPGWDFPYVVNPFGWIDELRPVLTDNLYLAAVPTAEFYEPHALAEALADQLSASADRGPTAALARLRVLVPSPATAFAPIVDRPTSIRDRTIITANPGATHD